MFYGHSYLSLFLFSWWFPATRHIAPRFQHSTQQTSNFLASYLKKFFFYFIRKIRKNLLFLFPIVSLIFSGFLATAVSVYRTVAFFIFGFFFIESEFKISFNVIMKCLRFFSYVSCSTICLRDNRKVVSTKSWKITLNFFLLSIILRSQALSLIIILLLFTDFTYLLRCHVGGGRSHQFRMRYCIGISRIPFIQVCFLTSAKFGECR